MRLHPLVRRAILTIGLAGLWGVGAAPALAAAPPAPCAIVERPAIEGMSRTPSRVGAPLGRQGVASAQNPAAGLYLFEDHIDLANWRAIYHAGISSTFIDGAAIMLNWKSIEPAPGQYCWAALDLELSDVLKLGKTFTLGLVSGGQAPLWLYNTAGVPALRDVPFNPTLNKTGANCSTLNQPLVWDDRYLRQYAATMTALAQHLKTIRLPAPRSGTAFDALVAVKLSGINVGTEELRLDAHPPSAVCHEPDVTAMWRQRGYRPQLVFQAWTRIARTTAAAYPGKLLNLDVILNAPFPDIDANGAVYPPPNGPGKRHVVEPLNAQILNYAVTTYRRGLLVQWDALSQDGILPVEVTGSGKRGALMGYQMNGFGGGNFGGSGCIYNPGFVTGPCRSVNDFAQALLDGIRSGARYIEVQPTDVAVQYLAPPNPEIPSYLPALRLAQEALRQPTAPPPPPVPCCKRVCYVKAGKWICGDAVGNVPPGYVPAPLGGVRPKGG